MYVAVEKNGADTARVYLGRHRDERGRFGCGTVARFAPRAGKHRARTIDNDKDLKFSLFFEKLHIGLSHARGHVPVDGAHVVAAKIFTYAAEFDPLPAEQRTERARFKTVGERSGGETEQRRLFCERFSVDGEQMFHR